MAFNVTDVVNHGIVSAAVAAVGYLAHRAVILTKGTPAAVVAAPVADEAVQAVADNAPALLAQVEKQPLVEKALLDVKDAIGHVEDRVVALEHSQLSTDDQKALSDALGSLASKLGPVVPAGRPAGEPAPPADAPAAPVVPAA